MENVTTINPQFDWLTVRKDEQANQTELTTTYAITDEMYRYATDPAERARVERDMEANTGLIVFNALTDDSVDSATAPIGLLIKDNHLLTFFAPETNYLGEYVLAPSSALRMPAKSDLQPMDAAISLMYRATSAYLDRINQIDQKRIKVQRSLKANPQHSAVDELMDLETRLVYYLSSLRANTAMLQELQRLPVVPLNDAQKEHLDDILIESKQGLEMAQMASDIAERVSSSYANRLDSNLNNTMKLLTAYSVILTMPSIVSGFFGQNTGVPFQNSTWGWQISIGITAILGYIAYRLLRRAHLFDR